MRKLGPQHVYILSISKKTTTKKGLFFGLNKIMTSRFPDWGVENDDGVIDPVSRYISTRLFFWTRSQQRRREIFLFQPSPMIFNETRKLLFFLFLDFEPRRLEFPTWTHLKGKKSITYRRDEVPYRKFRQFIKPAPRSKITWASSFLFKTSFFKWLIVVSRVS